MTATVTTPILAIDLGKYKSVGCWYDLDTALDALAPFRDGPADPSTCVWCSRSPG